MLHKAKKAYYACDVIRFLVPYPHPVYSPSGSCHSDVTSLPPLYRYPLSIAWLRVCVARYTFLFSLAWPWRMKSLVKHNMLKLPSWSASRMWTEHYFKGKLSEPQRDHLLLQELAETKSHFHWILHITNPGSAATNTQHLCDKERSCNANRSLHTARKKVRIGFMWLRINGSNGGTG